MYNVFLALRGPVGTRLKGTPLVSQRTPSDLDYIRTLTQTQADGTPDGNSSTGVDGLQLVPAGSVEKNNSGGMSGRSGGSIVSNRRSQAENEPSSSAGGDAGQIPKDCGMTKKEYRTFTGLLVNENHIKSC